MITYYRLDKDKNAIPCSMEELTDSFLEYHIVKQEDVGDKWISTVFLSIDYNWNAEKDRKPLIFETMIRDTPTGSWNDYQARYSTYQEALDGHNAVVEKLKKGLSLDDNQN